MTPLEQLRVRQHDDERLPSDEQLEAYLAEISPATAYRDLEPRSAVERRHLAAVRNSK